MDYLRKMLVAGFSLLVFHPHLHAQLAFAPAVNYEVGVTPFSVAVADVNGDGWVDFISTSLVANKVSVWTNNWSGSFAPSSTNIVGEWPWSVAAADLNGDGWVDLVTANNSDYSLSVLTNDGSGHFALAGLPALSVAPNYVTAADVNGDGKPDLIAGNSVLTNDGNSGFAIASSLPAGATDTLTTADINDDGRSDLISVNLGWDNTFSVLANSGNGSFTPAASPTVSWPGGTYYLDSVAAADVNGDGKLDLIGGNLYSPILLVLTNDGNGSFVLASWSYTTYAPARHVIAVDLNGDGKSDLACTTFDTLLVLTNDGSGGFELACDERVGRFPTVVAAADVNGDGRLDLIVANSSDTTVSVLINMPILAIKRMDASAVVSWPSSWKNWVLQQNSNPATTNWSASTGVSDNGTNKSLTVSSPSGSLFFRLSHL